MLVAVVAIVLFVIVPIGALLWHIRPARPARQLSRRQEDAFAQRDGEDAYAFLARTHRTLPRLMMLRSGSRKQVEAIQLYAQLKMVRWTRTLTFGTVILGVL